MSKKIMKRSLALGALMAFVITGSAMAGTITGNETQRISVLDTYDLGSSNVTIDSSSSSWVKSGNLDQSIVIGYGDGNFTSRTDYYVVNLKDNETLTLIANATDGVTGAIGWTKIIGTDTSKVVIKQVGNGSALGYYSKDEIKAGTIELYATVDAIYSTQAGESHKLEGKKIIIDAGKIGAYVAGSANVDIKASESIEITAPVALRSNIGSEVYVGSVAGETKADIIINGNIESLNDGKVDVRLETKDSSLNGSVKAYSASYNTGANRNLTLSNGATWNVKGVSDVTTLSGEGGNIIVNDITEEQVAVGTDNTKKLTVAAAANATGITGDAEKDLEALSKTVVAGAEKKAAADTAKITGGSVYDEVSAEIKEDGTLGNVNKEVAAANVSVNDMVAVGMMSWRAEMNDMNKRMGELRNANGEHGVWVRMVRGESEYNSVKNQYNQYQLGYDEKLSVDKRWTVGVALSYTDAENNFAQGTGESTNKALSVYGSKLNDDGTFIDLIAKYARLENDFTVQGGQGDADYDTNAYSFSAEAGKRIQQGKGLWIEPQVELTYGKVSAVDYVTKNDVKVAQDGMESLVGRIGFSLGKDIEKGNVYARASYLYDFDGETKATLNNDAVLENDLGGGWWEVGVGANINLSKATYIYADIEKTFGGEVDTNWQWNLGVRYSF